MSQLTRRVAGHARIVASYDADALAYFAAMSVQPDDTRKGLINTYILALKAAGVWSLLDAIHLIAAHDAQAARLNMKGASYPLITSNSPTFTTDRGYQGDGTTSSLTINGYNQSSSTGKVYAQDSASAGVWVNAHPTPTSANSNPVLGTGGADSGPRIIPFSASNTMQARINPASAANSSFTTGESTNLGFAAISRTSSTSIDGYRNGSAVTVANSSGSIAASVVNLLNQSNTLFSAARLAMSFVGGGLNPTQMAALRSATSTILTAIGAN